MITYTFLGELCLVKSEKSGKSALSVDILNGEVFVGRELTTIKESVVTIQAGDRVIIRLDESEEEIVNELMVHDKRNLLGKREDFSLVPFLTYEKFNVLIDLAEKREKVEIVRKLI